MGKLLLLLIFCAVTYTTYSFINKEPLEAESNELIIGLEELAEEDDVDSQIKLALKYYRGEGVSQDYKKTYKWIKKAADKGNDYAQFFLGGLYQTGKGVKEDPVRAYYYFDLAATNGNLKAKNHLECLNKGVSPESIAETKKMIEICSKDIWSIRSTDDLLNWIVCNL